MAMGTTGTVNITRAMMDNIVNAVEEYQGKEAALKQRLEDEVNGLIPEYFSGEAANGFKDFYTNNIVPANGEGLTQLLDAITQMAKSILSAIPGEGGLDDQLADGNRQ